MPLRSPKTEALTQAREHGLWGRVDSPPDWQRALDGATAGEPILVKDPTDPRDDFYLVPLIPSDPASTRSAWIMLDPATLKLREAALLDHWKAPLFPNDGQASRIANVTLQLPDGTPCRFSENELKPNRKNLVWRASDATILPYWPLKEWNAPHPVTHEPVSIYLTQEGELLTLLADGTISRIPGKTVKSTRFPWIRLGLVFLVGVLAGIVYQSRRHNHRAPLTVDYNLHAEEIERLSHRLNETQTLIVEKERQIQRLLRRTKTTEPNKSDSAPDQPDYSPAPQPRPAPDPPREDQRHPLAPSPIPDRP